MRSIKSAITAVVALVATMAVVINPFSAPVAAAAPTLTVTVTAPARALIQSPATAVTVTATAANTSVNNGYNVGFRAVLPAGVTYATGSSSVGGPTQVAGPGGTTVLWWENVSDILAASSTALTFAVDAANGQFPVNETLSIPVSAYTHSDPRTVPTLGVAGAVNPSTQDASASATTATKLIAIEITKAEPSPEHELLRGIHQHATVYTLTVKGNGAFADTSTVVDDYLDAGLEFLACGDQDNTTNAPTNVGSTEEYPGAGSISAGVAPDLVVDCPTPVLVETLTLDPDGAGPLPNAVYTHVRWNVGTIAVSGTKLITYYAGIPLLENTTTWVGAAPATACAAGTCPEAANVDNNRGAETTDEQPRRNLAGVSGTYPGPMKTGTNNPVTDSTVAQVSTEDLRMQKSVDPTVVEAQGLSTWTIDIATGEYRGVSGPMTVVDTLPDGLCPLGLANLTTSNQAADAECDPVSGWVPTISVDGAAATALPYTTADENTDGSWTVTWVLPSPVLAASHALAITLPTRARVRYQENQLDASPVLAGDGWTNSVTIAPLNAQSIAAAPGSLPSVRIVSDDSSASQTSPAPAIAKEVGIPLPTGTVDCDTITWRDADTIADSANYYRPGDRVCYRIRLVLNRPALPAVGSALQYRDVDLADYLPPGFVFERFWGTNAATGETTNDEIVTVTTDPPVSTPAGQVVAWHLGTPAGGSRYVDGANEKVFEAVFSAIIPAPTPGNPSLAAPASFLAEANLVKGSTRNTTGAATSLRNVAISNVTRPALNVDKTRTPSTATVAPNSTVTFTVAVKNIAPTEPLGTNFGAAYGARLRDALPFELTCADVVTPIANGGVCTDGVTTGLTVSPARSVIDWTIAGPINPQATASVSYAVTLPTDLAPDEDLTNTAGVRDYLQKTNTGSDITVVPPTAPQLDPAAVPNDTVNAIDSETLNITPATVAKTQASSIAETGNASNGTPAHADDQATIGEQIHYVIQTTIPAGTTVYDPDGAVTGGAYVRDVLPTGTRLVGTPTATLNSVPTTATVAGGTITVALPSPYLVPAGGPDAVVDIAFDVMVQDVPAFVQGSTITNTGELLFKTKAADMGVEPGQVRIPTDSVNAGVVEPAPTITKTDDDTDGIVVANQSVGYTLTVGNSGTSPAHDLVVTDCVPVGLSVDIPVPTPGSPAGVVPSVTAGPGAPGCTGTVITWTFPSTYALNAAATTALTYSATVVDPAVANETLTNSADVTANSTQGVNADERAYSASTTDSVTVATATITKTHLPEPATIGEPITYTITGTIPANVRLYDATFSDTLPAGTTYLGNPTIACAPASCSPSSTSIIGATAGTTQGPATFGFWLGDIAASTVERTVTITYEAAVTNTVTTVAPASFANTADFRWNLVDTLPATAPASVPTLATGTAPVVDTANLVEPKLLIDKDVSVTTCDHTADAPTGSTDADACTYVPNGTALTYTITVKNTGTSPAYDAVITDNADLPSSAFSGVSIPAVVGVTVADSSIVDGDGLEFDLAAPIAAGGVVTITYTAALAPSASLAQLQQVVNTAMVSSYFGLPSGTRAAVATGAAREYTEAPADTDTVTLHYPVPTIAKSAVSNASDARIGSPFTWQLAVGNTDSTATLAGYTVVDTLPAGWDYVAGSATVTALTAGATPAVGAIADPTVAGQTLTWSALGNLPSGSTLTIRFDATPNNTLAAVGTTGSFVHTNSATITGTDATGAGANADGSYTATSTADAAIRRVDLSLVKAIDTAGPYAFGQTVDYSLTVADAGPDASTGLTVTDALPPGLTYLSTVSATQGTFTPGTSTWDVGALANGATAKLVIRVRIDAVGSSTNTAQIASAQQYDPDSTPGDGSTTQDDDDSVTISATATSLGDLVWLDRNGDGVHNLGEPGIPGVTVSLFDAGPDGTFGTPDDPAVRTTTTSSIGLYSFGNLRIDRTYRVVVDQLTLPAGLTPTYDLDGTTVSPDGSADTTVPTLTANLAVDFGFRGVASIGDLVWYDRDNSGTATVQAGEPGLPGVPVSVVWAGFDLTFGTADDLTYPTTTDASGNYLVSNLPYGDYRVTLDPAGTTGLTPTYDLDGTGTALTAARTLSAGTPNPRDVDFSFTGTGSLGDFVWLDQDADGVQDAGELGIPGLTVTLRWFGPDGIGGNADDVVLTTTTNSSGLYLFDHLPAGRFSVTVNPAPSTLPSFDLDGISTANTASLTLTAGQARTDVDFGYKGNATIGDRVWFDALGNGDGVFDAGVDLPLGNVPVSVLWAGVDGTFGTADDVTYPTSTDSTGTYSVGGLSFGNYRVTAGPFGNGLTRTYDLDGTGTANSADRVVTALAANPTDVDFSVTGPGSVGDRLWFDVDGDGASAMAVGDQPLAAVTVTVTWLGPDGVTGGGDDLVFTRVTDTSGNYLVDHLPLGNYTVVVDPTGLPAGVAGSFDADGIVSAHRSAVTLTALAPARTDQDFAYTGTGSLGDRVWLDLDGDGVQDAGEPGLAGVVVNLTFTGPAGTPVTLTATTDATGAYQFLHLPAGTFTAAIDPATLPLGVTGTFDVDGVATMHTAAVTLTAGQARSDVDFGYRGTGSIGDRVWFDTLANGDGTFDAGADVVLAGASVTVTWAGVDGVLGTADDVALATTTDATGTYLVANLPFGPYSVVVDPLSLPAGLTPTFDLDAVATANRATLSLGALTPARTDADFSYTGTGSIGDLVWHDRNGNGTVEPGEDPLAGVTVTVTWFGPDGVAGGGDDVAFVRTTAPDGTYSVANLPAGGYRVVTDAATLPAGFNPVYDVDGGRDRRSTVTLAGGQHRTDVDFGEREEADVAVVKTHPAAAVQSGDRISYTLAVRNLGPGVARTVTVTDPLPAGLTFVGAAGTGWSCSATGQDVSCALGAALAPAASAADITVTVDVGIAAAPQVVNTATVATVTPDPVVTNNTSSDPTIVNGVELSLSKALLDRLSPNKQANYRLMVTNHGPSVALASKVTVTDTLPAGLTGVSASALGFSCVVSATVVTCVSDIDIAVGETRQLDVAVKVDAKATGVLQNSAQVEGVSLDPVAANNAAVASGTVVSSLPRTGVDVLRVLTAAAAAVVIGLGLLLTARRRRPQHGLGVS